MDPQDSEAAFTFEQWVLFLAVVFRQRYRAVAERAFPEGHARLPLARAGKLTVVQVNSGEAVHFIFTATATAEHTSCRALTIAPPEGLSIQDWAMLHGDGYKRFVERTMGTSPVGHFVLFPGEGGEHGQVLEEAERLAREHAAELRR